MFLHLSGKSGFGEEADEDGAKSYSDDDGGEGQSSNASVPTTFLLESNGICFEAKVQEPWFH